jgi:septum site-determining protein MinC
MSSDENKALRLMGRVLTLSRLKVQSSVPQEIVEELTKLTLENPMLQQGLPVVIESDHELDLAWLVKVLKRTGVQVLGVGAGILSEQAMSLDIPILPADHTKSTARSPQQTNTPVAPRAVIEQAKLPTRLITDPVRSGQQVYAENSDLIVLAPVSSGAELIADGCIHIYGALRGRAIAGAKGNPQARIFCKKLEADLVAIAGVYMVAEQMPNKLQGKSVQVYLGDEGNIVIEALD